MTDNDVMVSEQSFLTLANLASCQHNSTVDESWGRGHFILLLSLEDRRTEQKIEQQAAATWWWWNERTVPHRRAVDWHRGSSFSFRILRNGRRKPEIDIYSILGFTAAKFWSIKKRVGKKSLRHWGDSEVMENEDIRHVTCNSGGQMFQSPSSRWNTWSGSQASEGQFII